MFFRHPDRRGVFFLFATLASLLFFAFFTAAEETESVCEKCKAVYVPGKTRDISALIITDRNCPFCATKVPEKVLKNKFPGMKFEVIDYQAKKAEKLIKQYKIQTLPFFIIDPLIKEEAGFDRVSFLFSEAEADEVLLKKEISGICRYLERDEIKNRIDFFLDFYAEGTDEILDALISFSREHKIDLNIYLVTSQSKKVGYPKEEVRVALAIKEIYPGEFTDYIYRRIKDIEKSSWIDTAEKEGLDYKKIRNLMASPQLRELVDNNGQLAEELTVGEGNVILIRNNGIFKVFDLVKEELESFF